MKTRATKKTSPRKRPRPATGKASWAASKPIPKFKNAAEEETFWATHELDEGGLAWEELVHEAGATRTSREHVYRVRLDDQEMAMLQAVAQEQGVPASVVIRDLVRRAGTTRHRVVKSTPHRRHSMPAKPK